MRIALSAGHNVYINGLFDPGAVCYPYVEADITKETVKNLIPLLKAQGHEVLDVTPYNQHFKHKKDHHVLRCKRVDNFKSNYYIDVHINAGKGTGVEVWVYSMNSKSVPKAKEISNNISKNIGISNRGVKTKPGFWSVSLCKAPGMIVEGAFIDTLSDMKKLNARNYAEEIARAFGKIQSPAKPSENKSENISTVLRRGSKGTQVRYLQMNLSGLGYKGVSIDGMYGPGTESGVRRFQQTEGLSADGIAGPKTLNKMDIIIRGLQSNLNKLGYNVGKVDGVFGNGTKNAVIAFQRDYGLTADGIPGKYTMAKLNEVIKPQPKPGKLYRVQTGAFSKRNNADNLVKELKKKGYDAIVVKQGNLYKVQTGAFKERENADKLVGKLKKDGFEAFVI